MELAYITSDVARWARERSGFTRDELAAQLRIRPEQLAEWEAGRQQPAFGKAQDLARILRIPFGYLFLSNPPKEEPPIPDLRSVDDKQIPPSPDFIDLLNDTLTKQEWYAEFAKDQERAALPFVGRFSLKTPVAELLGDIQTTVDVTSLRTQASSWSDYLRLLTESAEDAGLIVMRSGVVRGNPHRTLSVAEFRGFAISHRYAPLIFINSRDAISAQAFTFAHELIHIWIGQSGISNPEPFLEDQSLRTLNRIETFCNAAAAELLVPTKEFSIDWTSSGVDLRKRGERLARKYKVSVPVILRRAFELNLIKRDLFFELWGAHREKIEALEAAKDDEEKSGGNFYNTFFARNSQRLSRAVISSVQAGEISALQAARLLNVRSTTIPKLLKQVAL